MLNFLYSVSILETSLSNESDKNAKAIRLAMENDTSVLDGTTVDYYENFNIRLKRSRASVKKPNPVKLVDVVRNILLSPKPHFRYQINRVCKEAVRSKLTDESGDVFIEEIAQKYLEWYSCCMCKTRLYMLGRLWNKNSLYITIHAKGFVYCDNIWIEYVINIYGQIVNYNHLLVNKEVVKITKYLTRDNA